ncbi:MAG: agmatinase [Rhodospirillales bacterium]|nr:agmatinase [Rhodospirillales bacterium]
MQYLKPADGFLGLAGDEPAPTAAKLPTVVVVPFGLEATVSYGRGTGNGPAAIIEASHQVELFDDELWCEPIKRFHLKTAKPFPIRKKIAAALGQIAQVVDGVLDAGGFPLVLGGEHSLTAGAIRPFARRHRDLVLLHFDAHADLRDGYHGEPYSHAAALRRCLDDETLTLISLGIRNISAGEVPFLEANRHRIDVYWARDRADWDLGAIEKRLAGRPVYVTFDLDAFDSSLMPATGTPEPGGIFWDDALRVIRMACAAADTVVGADITELAPAKPFHGCAFLAAKLAYKILGYRFAA